MLEAMKWLHISRYGAVMFRRNTTHIRQQGGLWESSNELYPLAGGRGIANRMLWVFPSGAKIRMAHLEHEKTKYQYQGGEIPLIIFDELTHFSAGQFWYMLSRNRSTCGIRPYMRGATNPDPDSWVRTFIDWWIGKDGFPIDERCGKLRWFVRRRDELHWADTKEELEAKFGKYDKKTRKGVLPKSVTFIRADIFDNPALLDINPDYLGTLEALPLVEREQLLKGNWNIRASAGMVFKREWFEVVKAAPADALETSVRYWDRAATQKTSENDPDATVGLRLLRDRKGVFYVHSVKRMFETAFKVDTAIINTASQDGVQTIVGFMQDPGSAGKNEAEATARMLAGYIVKYAVATGDKVTRARAASVQAEAGSSQAKAGNIKLIEGDWNEAFLRELENFPPAEEGKGHDDIVDALSGAMEIILGRGGNAPAVRPGHSKPDERPGERFRRPAKQRHGRIMV